MCGIAGLIMSRSDSSPISSKLDAMSSALTHRGPDGAGTWADTDAGVGLTHRRLSVVDLSKEGEQPTQSSDGRFILSYNGEIYNHDDLRSQLAESGRKLSWRGRSDTETLVECIAYWGLDKTLESIVGMFAFAVWDRERGSLSLARDRIGEKPLYYTAQNGNFAFSSEIRALRLLKHLDFEIDPDAASSVLQYGYIREPRTIYKGVHKLPAGASLTLKPHNLATSTFPAPRTYWSLPEIAERGQAAPREFSDPTQAADELQELITRAVKGQLMGDVPVGAFLSGGIDSSLVSAIMQANSTASIKTFSIGFENTKYDESGHAVKVANHLGTDHSNWTITHADAASLIPELPRIWDEPFGDSSQIPTYFVSLLAKKSVTVSLSGDGGDELFGGYNRYLMAGQNWGRISRVPLGLRSTAARIAQSIPTRKWDELANHLFPMLPRRFRFALPGDKVHKVAKGLSRASSIDLYEAMVSAIEPSRLARATDTHPPDAASDQWTIDSDLTHQMMALDTVTYLPGDILVKVDRASMANSLESRMPFLDHRIIEWAWALPLGQKIQPGRSKAVLRSVLGRFVPDELVNRPKMGFGIPLDEWLRGPLHEWASDLLSAGPIQESGYLKQSFITELWSEHTSGQRNWQYALWNILMLQSWLLAEESRPAECR